MAAVIEVLDPGLATTVQDRGRFGYRGLGVAVGGALDPRWAACANALLGNPPDAAVIEMRGLGPRLRAVGSRVTVALAGDVAPRLEREGEAPRVFESWRVIVLDDGDVLRVGTLGGGVAYLAIAGGLDVPVQLGSRSTHSRTGIGGRALRAGDRLELPPRRGKSRPLQARPLHRDGGPLRVLWGPQDDHFTPAARAAFTASEYVVTRDADRMGLRLKGAALAHDPARGADIVSDAVTPGAIQVPADGQPIVLLADCQTIGGYAKIATVIGADLPRLAHVGPGDSLRFAAVSRNEARAALREANAQFAAWVATLAPCTSGTAIDAADLLAQNLISGMVDAFAEPAP